MANTNLTVADGQVAAEATEILTGDSNAVRYNLSFHNVGDAAETLVLTLSRDGGTARRLKRVELAPAESLEVSGLPLNKTDSLLAETTTADAGDYVIAKAPDQQPAGSVVYDAEGIPKTAPVLIEQLAQILG